MPISSLVLVVLLSPLQASRLLVVPSAAGLGPEPLLLGDRHGDGQRGHEQQQHDQQRGLLLRAHQAASVGPAWERYGVQEGSMLVLYTDLTTSIVRRWRNGAPSPFMM